MPSVTVANRRWFPISLGFTEHNVGNAADLVVVGASASARREPIRLPQLVSEECAACGRRADTKRTERIDLPIAQERGVLHQLSFTIDIRYCNTCLRDAHERSARSSQRSNIRGNIVAGALAIASGGAAWWIARDYDWPATTAPGWVALLEVLLALVLLGASGWLLAALVAALRANQTWRDPTFLLPNDRACIVGGVRWRRADDWITFTLLCARQEYAESIRRFHDTNT
jgi:hypothetical protein